MVLFTVRAVYSVFHQPTQLGIPTAASPAVEGRYPLWEILGFGKTPGISQAPEISQSFFIPKDNP